VAALFRRKSAVVEEPVTEPAEESTPTEAQNPPKGYTPSKKERGIVTPKRPSTRVRRPDVVNQPPRSRKDMTKEERQALREERRRRRQEITEGMRRGDDRYLTARDRGPERALARDVVDRRRTVGTWFFGGALLVLFASSPSMPEPVRLAGNVMWALLAVGVIIDCVLLCRKLKKLIRERFPDTKERMGSLYLYVVMRSITFRRMRMPAPRVQIGEAI
jgi:hypothetical protein